MVEDYDDGSVRIWNRGTGDRVRFAAEIHGDRFRLRISRKPTNGREKVETLTFDDFATLQAEYRRLLGALLAKGTYFNFDNRDVLRPPRLVEPSLAPAVARPAARPAPQRQPVRKR